jgi:imidazolonepropionase-like amidohydrolase
MHVHLVGGWDGEGVDMLGYRRYLSALLYSGVTTVLDTGNVQPYVLQLRQEIEAGRLPGPRIYCAGPLLDGADPIWPPITLSVTSLEQIPKLVTELKASGVDILKAYAGLSDRMVRRLSSEGRKVSLPVFIDQGPRNGSLDLVDAGIAAFAHTPARDLSDDAIARLKEKDIHIVTTLAVFESFSRRRLADLAFLETPLIRDTTPPWFLEELRAFASRPSSETDAALERTRAGQINAKKLFDAGVLLAAGTDAPDPGVFQGEGLHRELELLVEAGLTPIEAITVGTRNAARLMNAENDWGTLTAGSLANVVVVRGRPDRNISETRNIEMVIQKGRLLDREKLRFDPSVDPGFRVSSRANATPEP